MKHLTAHEVARILLDGPDSPLKTVSDVYDRDKCADVEMFYDAWKITVEKVEGEQCVVIR